MHAYNWKYSEFKKRYFLSASQAQSTPVNCVFIEKWIICTVIDKMLDVSGLCFFLSDNPDKRLIVDCVYYKLRLEDMGQNVFFNKI